MLLRSCGNTIFGGSAQIITVSHEGGQFKLLQYITWGVNLGSTETPKMYYVIYERPPKDAQVRDKMRWQSSCINMFHGWFL